MTGNILPIKTMYQIITVYMSAHAIFFLFSLSTNHNVQAIFFLLIANRKQAVFFLFGLYTKGRSKTGNILPVN